MSCSPENRVVTRRHAIALSSAACAACSSGDHLENSPVAIVRAESYDQRLFEKTRRLLTELKLDVRGKNVVVKPNLVEFDSTNVVNTHPLLVQAVVEALCSLDAAAVRIAEGPGHRRQTLDLAEEAGYFSTVTRFEDLFTDLNLDDVAPVRLQQPVSRLESLYLPKVALQADLIVSIPKLKTHHWVGATLSMKNLFGLVPGAVYGWPKNILHWAGIDESIADLYSVFPRHFAIVDGIEGMEGNGPIQGSRKHVGALIAGHDLPAVDATCCQIMGIDPAKILYLQLARRKFRPVQVAEHVTAVRSDFALIPQFERLRLGHGA